MVRPWTSTGNTFRLNLGSRSRRNHPGRVLAIGQGKQAENKLLPTTAWRLITLPDKVPGGLRTFRQPGSPEGTHSFASHPRGWFAFIEEPGSAGNACFPTRLHPKTWDTFNTLSTRREKVSRCPG